MFQIDDSIASIFIIVTFEKPCVSFKSISSPVSFPFGDLNLLSNDFTIY